MTLFIAHRGNTHGAEPEWENTSEQLLYAYNLGHGVECDLQLHKGVLYYGHDEPQEPADLDFVSQDRVFCHAKTVPSMMELIRLGVHSFWHQEDDITLTSQGYIWCYPGVHPRSPRAIWLDLGNKRLPEDQGGIYAVCGDNQDIIKND